jgi:hypothetical protein
MSNEHTHAHTQHPLHTQVGMRVCITTGCRKQKRRDGLCHRCLAGPARVGKPVLSAPATKSTVELRPRFPCLTASGFAQVVQVNPVTLTGLINIADQLPKGGDKQRVIHPFDKKDNATAVSMCEALAHELRYLNLNIAKVSSVPTVIAAPAHSQQAAQNRNKFGAVHRDVDTVEDGYFTVLICLTDVTTENGSVSLWPGSQLTPCDYHHRGRAVVDRRAVVLTGTSGTAWVFDSRLLHQSNPNSTEETRLTLQFMCYTTGVMEPKIFT